MWPVRNSLQTIDTEIMILMDDWLRMMTLRINSFIELVPGCSLANKRSALYRCRDLRQVMHGDNNSYNCQLVSPGAGCCWSKILNTPLGTCPLHSSSCHHRVDTDTEEKLGHLVFKVGPCLKCADKHFLRLLKIEDRQSKKTSRDKESVRGRFN